MSLLRSVTHWQATLRVADAAHLFSLAALISPQRGSAEFQSLILTLEADKRLRAYASQGRVLCRQTILPERVTWSDGYAALHDPERAVFIYRPLAQSLASRLDAMTQTRPDDLMTLSMVGQEYPDLPDLATFDLDAFFAHIAKLYPHATCIGDVKQEVVWRQRREIGYTDPMLDALDAHEQTAYERIQLAQSVPRRLELSIDDATESVATTENMYFYQMYSAKSSLHVDRYPSKQRVDVLATTEALLSALTRVEMKWPQTDRVVLAQDGAGVTLRDAVSDAHPVRVEGATHMADAHNAEFHECYNRRDLRQALEAFHRTERVRLTFYNRVKGTPTRIAPVNWSWSDDTVALVMSMS